MVKKGDGEILEKQSKIKVLTIQLRCTIYMLSGGSGIS